MPRVKALASAACLAAFATIAAMAQGSPTINGEVTKVEAGKVTIKHEPIPKLDMPAMTMEFQVKDPAMLKEVKPGDKIKFEAEKAGGGYTVTKMEKAK